MFTTARVDFGPLRSVTARAADAACQGITNCQREVLVYFGITYVAAADLGSLVNVNDIINDYLRGYLGPNTPPRSYFDGNIVMFGNGLVCAEAEEASKKMGC